MQAGTLTFTFASPVESFGAYFSGVQFSSLASRYSFPTGRHRRSLFQRLAPAVASEPLTLLVSQT